MTTLLNVKYMGSYKDCTFDAFPYNGNTYIHSQRPLALEDAEAIGEIVEFINTYPFINVSRVFSIKQKEHKDPYTFFINIEGTLFWTTSNIDDVLGRIETERTGFAFTNVESV